MTDLSTRATALRAAIHRAASAFVDRELLVELMVLAAVAGEHLLIIGPPGTAKSAAVHRIADELGGRYFEYLLGRFTEPNELFGPIDLVKLRDGRVESRTEGMLPEADIAFLDEVFLGSTAILNTLLTLLNERRYRRGHTLVDVPLRVAVGASNALPDEPALMAFSDRFLVHVFVDPTDDDQLETLLEIGWTSDREATQGDALAHLDVLAALARETDLSAIRGELAAAIRDLRGAGITLSDRRVVKTQRLIAAAALLDGRTEVTAADLWPLVYAVPTQSGQVRARDVLRARLAASHSRTLAHAAEAASESLRARAERIASEAEVLLAGPHTPARIQATLREIDASFAPHALPDTLAPWRARLLRALEAT